MWLLVILRRSFFEQFQTGQTRFLQGVILHLDLKIQANYFRLFVLSALHLTYFGDFKWLLASLLVCTLGQAKTLAVTKMINRLEKGFFRVLAKFLDFVNLGQ